MRSLPVHLGEHVASSQRASRCCSGNSVVSSGGEASSSVVKLFFLRPSGESEMPDSERRVGCSP